MDYDLLSELSKESGLALDTAALERAESKARIDLSQHLERGSSTESGPTLEVYVSSILEHTGLRKSLGMAPKDFDSRRSRLIETLQDPDTWGRIWSRTPPRLQESLEQLRAAGIQLLIVSNADGTVADKLAAASLLPCFDRVIDSGQLGIEKPDPRIFEAALEAAGCPAQKVAHVGDLPSVDLEGARRAGIHAVLVDPFGDFESAHPGRYPSTCRNTTELAEAILAQRMGRSSPPQEAQ